MNRYVKESSQKDKLVSGLSVEQVYSPSYLMIKVHRNFID